MFVMKRTWIALLCCILFVACTPEGKDTLNKNINVDTSITGQVISDAFDVRVCMQDDDCGLSGVCLNGSCTSRAAQK